MISQGKEKDLYLLDPNDYIAYINPKVIGETMTVEHSWEYCLSFPFMRCMIKRPIGINISYLDELGDEC